MRTVTVAERRARLARRHHLAIQTSDVVTVAGDLVGLHSTDPVSVYLGARARVTGFAAEDLEHALYEERSLARILGMRRTVFVTPTPLVPVLHGAATRHLVPQQRRRNETFVQASGFSADAATWLAEVEEATLAALEARGQATARELVADVPELGRKLTVTSGKGSSEMGASTRVLFLLATEGRIVRGRPLGTWRSTQYRWAPTRAFLGVDPEALPTDQARAQLASAWLRAFGPGTLTDLQWWTGWTKTVTRAVLADLDVVEVVLEEGAAGLLRADDLEPVRAPDATPWIALLPALDTTTMGWKERDWYLSDHARRALFDRMGNAGPTVWVDGRVVGGWAHRADGEVVLRLLTDVGAETREAVEREAAEVAAWLGEVRFTPRFRTPLEVQLTT